MEDSTHRKHIKFKVFTIFVFIILIGIIIACLAKIKTLNSTLDTKSKRITTLNAKIKDLEAKNLDYFIKIGKYEQQIEFMDKYVVICPLDGSGLYHIYGCEKLDLTKSFYIYNITLAPNQGYSPCSCCSHLSNTNNKKTEIVYVTNTGTKYHRDGCSYLKSKKAITKTEAIKKGYSACSRCNP